MDRPRPSSTGERTDAGVDAPLRNLLLAALPDGEFLAPFLERTAFETDETIYGVGDAITRYVFPVSGIVSVVKESLHGRMEVATAGVEGMAGIPALLGVPVSTARVFAQTPVAADCVSVEVVDNLMAASRSTRDLFLRYVHVVHEEACQSILCGRYHTLEERCARWLLLSNDRLGSKAMPLKQRFLSYMLGVHRPAVSVAASALQKQGLIHYTRGRIDICDREGLERASCACYAVTRENFRRVRLLWGAASTIGSDTRGG
jgi:CRP-like cAMP-binding protein